MICGSLLFIVAVISMYLFNAIPFKVIFALFAFVAAFELGSFFERKNSPENILLTIFELILLALSITFVIRLDDINEMWYLIFGVCGYDVFAYLSGRLIGGKIIKHHRPFPRISKNKTWEGTICGLVISTSLTAVLLVATGSTKYIYLLGGVLALIGDLYESYLKRHFGVKDSNGIVIRHKFFQKLELVVGGSEGHGGFLDRIDSFAFASSVFLVLSLLFP